MKQTLATTLLVLLLLMSCSGMVHGQGQDAQASGGAEDVPAAAPELAAIVPLANELSGRLVTLENKISRLLDLTALKKNYTEIDVRLKDTAAQVLKLKDSSRVKDSKDYRSKTFDNLKEQLKQELELHKDFSKPLLHAIRQLGSWREDWLDEQKRWSNWRSSLLVDGEIAQLKKTFANADETIDTALNLILPQLQAMLEVQEKAGKIVSKITSLSAVLDGMIVDKERGRLLGTSSPMFSSAYFSQFDSELWHEVQNGFDGISWPGRLFLTGQGWIVLIQVFLAFAVIITIHRYRQLLKESQRWRFMALRPYAAGLFLSCMATYLIYEYHGAPAIWVQAINIVAGISFTRVLGCLLVRAWERQYVYGLVFLYIVNSLLDVIGFPLSLLRLYVVLAAFASLFLCWRWAAVGSRLKDSLFYIWGLRLSSIFFAVIILVELWGKDALGIYLFVSLIDSMTTAIIFLLFVYIIRGSMVWLFHSSPLRRRPVLHSDDSKDIIRQMNHFMELTIAVLVLLPGFLLIWGVYNSLEEAIQGTMAFGFNLGAQRLSVGLLIAAAGILYGSFFVSWILQKLLMDEALIKQRFEKGVRLSMVRLVHYAVIFVGSLIAISTLGFEITKLTIMLSALGVGIGFGLQGVVNNFVSGLILLFERPVRVGDVVEITNQWAEIKRIGLRATTVQTFDEADVIIPNADLVNNQVTNWTLSSRRVRLIIPVGVAYGSDVKLVMETLVQCAKDHEKITTYPPLQVFFLSFGESSLDFELRVWVTDADNRLSVKSDIHCEIDRRFRQEKIEIAFPQRDLHLRSVDEKVGTQLLGKDLQEVSPPE